MIWTQNKATKDKRLQPLWISSTMHKSCCQWLVTSNAPGTGLKLYLLSSTWGQSLTLWRSFPLVSSQLRPSLHRTNQVISLPCFPGTALEWLPANPRASGNEEHAHWGMELLQQHPAANEVWLKQHHSDVLCMAATSGVEFKLSFRGQRAENHIMLWSHLDYSSCECRDS